MIKYMRIYEDENKEGKKPKKEKMRKHKKLM
jgi:hypothetical protein